MPKWCATSCTTVIRTSSTSSASVSQRSRSGPRKMKIRSGSSNHVGHAGALGQRHALVEPEQVVGLVGRRLVLDQHHDVADQRRQLVGDPVESLVDQRVEAVGAHLDRHPPIVTGPETARKCTNAPDA